MKDKIPPIANSGQWVVADGSLIDNLGSEGVNSIQATINASESKLADMFIKQAISDITSSYHYWWVHESDNFRGIFVDPTDLLEHFEIVHEDRDVDMTVSFSLRPNPRIDRGDFDAYGIRVMARGSDFGLRVKLHGIAMLGEEFGESGCFLSAGLKDMAFHPEQLYDSGRFWLFTAIDRHDELWWHRAVYQSIMFHINRGDEPTKPMEAFLKLAKHDEIPSKEEFTNMVDKIKLVEGLE